MPIPRSVSYGRNSIKSSVPLDEPGMDAQENGVVAIHGPPRGSNCQEIACRGSLSTLYYCQRSTFLSCSGTRIAIGRLSSAGIPSTPVPDTKMGTGNHSPGPRACLLGGIAPSQPRTYTTPAPRLARLIAPLSRIELRLAGCYKCLLTGEPWVGNHWQDGMYLVCAHWNRPRISCVRRNPFGFGSLCIVPIHLHPKRIFDAFNLIAATFARAVAGV